MKKREIKKRKEHKKSTSYAANSNKKIRGRIRVRRKFSIQIKLAIFLALVAALLICYLKLGQLYTAAIAVVLFFILGLVYIFTRKGKTMYS